MKKTSALAAALSGSGARVSGSKPLPEPAETPTVQPIVSPPIEKKPQPGRVGTMAITVHMDEAVRHQLKMIALEEKRTVHSVVAESFNLMFASRRKPEIAK